MIDPEHPVRPAFDMAQDSIAYLESRLTEEQKVGYDKYVERQKREKEEQERKTAQAKAEYDQAKEKTPHLVKNYDPPGRIRDPHLRRMAYDARTEQNNLIILERTQVEDKLRYLEKLDRERESQTQQREEGPGEKQARFRDNAQEVSRDRALSRAFARAKSQDQARQRSQSRSQEHGRHRDRGRK